MKEHHNFQEDHLNSSGSSLAMSSSFGTTTPERHSSFSQDSGSTLHRPSSSEYSPTIITPSHDDSAVIIEKRKLGKKAKSYAYGEHVTKSSSSPFLSSSSSLRIGLSTLIGKPKRKNPRPDVSTRASKKRLIVSEDGEAAIADDKGKFSSLDRGDFGTPFTIDRSGHLGAETSKISCGTCSCEICNDRMNRMMTKIESFELTLNTVMSKRGVIPSSRVVSPYTPIYEKGRRRQILKALMSVKKRATVAAKEKQTRAVREEQQAAAATEEQ